MNRPMNVLLVEDNEGDVELTRIAFKKIGVPCTLSVVYDGQEAVEYLYKRGSFKDAETPDLVLVDLNMPRMGGKEFLEVVKNDDELKSVPVMILSSSQNPAEVLECYRRHANCYVLKPAGLEDFMNLAKQIESFWSRFVYFPS